MSPLSPRQAMNGHFQRNVSRWSFRVANEALLRRQREPIPRRLTSLPGGIKLSRAGFGVTNLGGGLKVVKFSREDFEGTILGGGLKVVSLRSAESSVGDLPHHTWEFRIFLSIYLSMYSYMYMYIPIYLSIYLSLYVCVDMCIYIYVDIWASEQDTRHVGGRTVVSLRSAESSVGDLHVWGLGFRV